MKVKDLKQGTVLVFKEGFTLNNLILFGVKHIAVKGSQHETHF